MPNPGLGEVSNSAYLVDVLSRRHKKRRFDSARYGDCKVCGLSLPLVDDFRKTCIDWGSQESPL